jgi:glutathione synthase/RimK-type ligase-like ATP-grasp enzyme
MVIEAAQRLGTRCILFNQRAFAAASMAFELSADHLSGWIEIEGMGYPLDAIHGVYTRLMDYRLLPELKNEPDNAELHDYCAALHDVLTHWCEVSPARVVNRVSPMATNSSKPYQAQLIQPYGFSVPETLITNDPDTVMEFRSRHGRIVYKSASGIRSIVQMFEDKDVERLPAIRSCPTQFQAYVEGEDVRVHVVNEEVFATRIASAAIDYRYARQQGMEPAQLTATDLPADLAEKCVRLTRGLGLAFAGIDLRIPCDGPVFCFEVNPCPGFSYFEANTGQPIALAVARYLTGQT